MLIFLFLSLSCLHVHLFGGIARVISRETMITDALEGLEKKGVSYESNRASYLMFFHLAHSLRGKTCSWERLRISRLPREL